MRSVNSKNTSQVAQIIDRLWARTNEGTLKWTQLGGLPSYETRLGDFSISIRGPATRTTIDKGLFMKIAKLDGTEVAQTGTGNALAILSAGFTPLPPTSTAVLEKLWEYITNRSSDLDELLKILK